MNRFLILILGLMITHTIAAQNESAIPEFQLELIDSAGEVRSVMLHDLSITDTRDSLVNVHFVLEDSKVPVNGTIFYAPARGDAQFIAFTNNAELTNAFRLIFRNTIKRGDRIILDRLTSPDKKKKHGSRGHNFSK